MENLDEVCNTVALDEVYNTIAVDSNSAISVASVEAYFDKKLHIELIKKL